MAHGTWTCVRGWAVPPSRRRCHVVQRKRPAPVTSAGVSSRARSAAGSPRVRWFMCPPHVILSFQIFGAFIVRNTPPAGVGHGGSLSAAHCRRQHRRDGFELQQCLGAACSSGTAARRRTASALRAGGGRGRSCKLSAAGAEGVWEGHSGAGQGVVPVRQQEDLPGVVRGGGRRGRGGQRQR